MPIFLSALLGGLLSIATSLVGRVLIALGVGYVTYKGVGSSFDTFLNNIKSGMAGLPPEVAGFLAYCWIDKAIGMMFSTWTASLFISGIGGSFTKMKIKGPAS